jgi:hypothetical protein
MTQHHCRDCGTTEGYLHTLGCDNERCPFCGGQLISCFCIYKKLGLVNRTKYGPATSYLPPVIYRKGVPEHLFLQWQVLLNEKGRVPYIIYPVLCARCGQSWPEFFSVPDTEWNHYIEKGERDKVLCHGCYMTIKRLIDTAAT